MNERDLWWKIVLVGVLGALAFASVYPLNSRINWGIDLAGGYSLLYEIDDKGMEGADRTNLSRRVMDVLQKRVDPNGVFNLVWRPVGYNRIEIQMPRQSDEVRKARQSLESAQEALRSTTLRRSQIVAAITRAPEDRAAAFDQLSEGVEGRVERLEKAAAAHVALKEAQAAYAARRAEAEQKNLKRGDVTEWVKLPPTERTAEIASLVRDVPGREALLNAAATAWDEFQAAKAREEAGGAVEGPTTQPVDAKTLEQVFNRSVATVLRTNLNVDSQLDGVTIDTVIAREEAFDASIADVLATNVDVGRLQLLLDMDPESKERQEGLEAMVKDHPSMADSIKQTVEATAELKKKRRGEGRLEDPADLQRLLRGAGVLEFRILPLRTAESNFDEHRQQLQERGPRPKPGELEYQWFEIEEPVDFLRVTRKELLRNFESVKTSSIHVVERFGDKYYVLANISENASMVHGRSEGRDWSLKSAYLTRDQNGFPAIGFTLDEIGGSKFSKLTRAHIGDQLCIFLDDKAISSANINSAIRNRGIIMGKFTVEEVNEAVKKLNAGSLPQKLKDPPISVRSIGPSLGAANKAAGLKAAAIGAIFVAVFMLIYYMYAGGIAVIAVVVNILLIGAMMSILGATMTLPGIAGLVLAIGMAVDANVLINERIREELERGTAMRMAVKLGYERAFRAILDSNLTTVLTCVILYAVGSEQVKGFGLTLGVGVFINIFTAYFVTRLFFDFMSMVTIPREVKRYPVYTAVGIAAVGAVLFALGYFANAPADRADSVAIGFGDALLFEVAPVVIGLFLLMYLARMLHAGKKTLPMLKLIGVPNVNWVRKRHVFFVFSAIVILIGVGSASQLDADDLLDIEFLGGTSAQLDLKEKNTFDSTADVPTQIAKRLDKAAGRLNEFAGMMDNAEVSGSGSEFVVRSKVPANRLEPIIQAELGDELSQVDPIQYEDPASEVVRLYTADDVTLDPATVKQRLAARMKQAAAAITGAQVQTNSAFESGGSQGLSYTVVTRETSKEIVVAAILDQMEKDLDVDPALSFRLAESAGTGAPYFPIRETDPRALGIELSDEAVAQIDLSAWQDGAAIVLEDIDPPQNLDNLRNRLREMRLQPGFEKYGWRESDVFGLDRAPGAGPETFSRVMVVVADPNYPLLDEQGGIAATWEDNLARPEVELIEAALQRQKSLAQVTQFDNQVSGESQIQAILALALSWLLIVVFVWVRFGNVRWGLSAVAALIHDVLIAFSAVAFTYYIAQFLPGLGHLLLIDKVFRIDLAMVAAFLTVVGYSVNDTIIVFDRIRENRGRQSEVSPEMVNASINQTLSRTILTWLTSIMTVSIMYIFGGEGIHSFNFVLFVGLTIGTYSSIGIASQFLLRRAQLKTA